MSDAENTTTEGDAIVSEEAEAVTASAPDRSEDDTAAGVASASEQPDASAASQQAKPDASAASQQTRHVRKAREGVVVSSKPDKTVVVAVIERVRHPKYNKFVLQTKKLYAHDEANDVNVGDRVRVMETRPLSKLKRWRVTDVLERAK